MTIYKYFLSHWLCQWWLTNSWNKFYYLFSKWWLIIFQLHWCEIGIKRTYVYIKKISLPTGVLSIKASSMFEFGIALILYVFILQTVWKWYSRRHIVVLYNTTVWYQRTIFIILVTIMKTICWISNNFISLAFS